MLSAVMTITLKLLLNDVILSVFNERAYDEFLFLSLKKEACIEIFSEINAHSSDADFIINTEIKFLHKSYWVFVWIEKHRIFINLLSYDKIHAFEKDYMLNVMRVLHIIINLSLKLLLWLYYRSFSLYILTCHTEPSATLVLV